MVGYRLHVRARVILVYPLPDPVQEARLGEYVEIVRPNSVTEDALAEALSSADGIVIRGPARLTRELIERAPRLRAIAAQGSGTDAIDVAAATAAGIPVIHGAGVAPTAVAEYVIGAMVVGHRRLPTMHRLLTEGPLDWEERMWSYRGFELAGSTLGIVGYGHIGRTIARMAKAAFDVDVCVFDPYVNDFTDEPVRDVSLDEVFSLSDTVTIHVPLTKDTRNLVGRLELELLGCNGVLVNASRGGIVDEEALVLALRGGLIKAAVMDVFEREPPERARLDVLARTPNLLLTPHVAGCTGAALEALSANVVDGLLAVLDGRPARLVNPEVLQRG